MSRCSKFCFSIAILFSIQFPSQELAASNQDFIKEFLNRVLLQSEEVKILQAQNRASLSEVELETVKFDLKHSLSISNTDDQSPATSPFAPNKIEKMSVTSAWSKEWVGGFDTSLDFSYSDNALEFSTNPTVSYSRTNLSLGVKTDLLRDIWGRRDHYLMASSSKSKDRLGLNLKATVKALLAKSLLDFSIILERRDEILLQKELCGKVQGQTNKLKVKRSRGSVAARDYLLSIKELNSCRSSIDNLEKQIFELETSFRLKFGFDIRTINSPPVTSFFSQVESYFSKFEKREVIKLEDRDLELSALRVQVDQLKQKQMHLDAETLPSLELEIKLGSAGLEDDFNSALEQTTGNENPYVFASIKSDWPFQGRQAKLKSTVNRYSLESVQRTYQLKRVDKYAKLDLLKKSLEKDHSIYKRELKNLKLSRQIYSEARRDFGLGRIDFFTLTEFQKGLTGTQKQLARLRTQIVVNTVEFLDYHQFFDAYVER